MTRRYTEGIPVAAEVAPCWYAGGKSEMEVVSVYGGGGGKLAEEMKECQVQERVRKQHVKQW